MPPGTLLHGDGGDALGAAAHAAGCGGDALRRRPGEALRRRPGDAQAPPFAARVGIGGVGCAVKASRVSCRDWSRRARFAGGARRGVSDTAPRHTCSTCAKRSGPHCRRAALEGDELESSELDGDALDAGVGVEAGARLSGVRRGDARCTGDGMSAHCRYRAMRSSRFACHGNSCGAGDAECAASIVAGGDGRGGMSCAAFVMSESGVRAASLFLFPSAGESAARIQPTLGRGILRRGASRRALAAEVRST